MAIRKRPKGWQIDYYDPSGKRVRQTFEKKKDAEAEHAKRVSLIKEGRYLDVKKECVTTLGALITKYEENFTGQRSFSGGKKLYLQNFREYFGENRIIDTIKYIDLETYRNRLREKITRRKMIRTDASVNREMSCLRHLFSKGFEWDLLEQNPFKKGKSLLVKENNKRLRFLTHEELHRLLEASPDHLRDIIVCAVNTGMRRGELFGLKWDQVKGGLIYLRETKTNEPRQIPINDTLAALFEKIRKQNPGSAYVFTYRRPGGKETNKGNLKILASNNSPLTDIKHAFERAVKKAEIEDFKFHDLRHTFASHLVMNGASLKVVQELLGHKTYEMTLRYSHLSQDHIKTAVNLLNDLTGAVDMGNLKVRRQ